MPLVAPSTFFFRKKESPQTPRSRDTVIAADLLDLNLMHW